MGEKIRKNVLRGAETMVTINKKDIKRVAQDTCNWPKNCGFSTMISINLDDGRIWASDIQDTSDIIWRGNVVTVCRTSKHISAKKLTGYITELLNHLNCEFEIV